MSIIHIMYTFSFNEITPAKHFLKGHNCCLTGFFCKNRQLH